MATPQLSRKQFVVLGLGLWGSKLSGCGHGTKSSGGLAGAGPATASAAGSTGTGGSSGTGGSMGGAASVTDPDAGSPASTVLPDPVIDAHLHVWSDDPVRYPFAHPFDPTFKPRKAAGTVEVVIKEMDELHIDRCLLVQTVEHGWDNRYLAACLAAHPRRFRAHGLIDPTDPAVADKLEFWVREHNFSGMRMSPIYYRGKDDWMNGPAHQALWKKAEQLGSVFNYFLTTPQLAKLEDMIGRFPNVPVVIDHLSRIDLNLPDPLPEFKKLLALARYPNVWVKVSELGNLSPSHQYPFRDTFPWVRMMYDAFGPDRMLWGTGFPGPDARAEVKWPTGQQELDLIRQHIDFFTAEDRKKILGRNAARLWRFDAT